MANEITTNVRLKFAKGFLSYDKNVNLQATMTGSAYMSDVQNIGTTYEQITVNPDIATVGYSLLRNLDATNYVEVGVVVSATFYPVLKLKAGEAALARLGTNTLYAKANTAAVNLEVVIAEA